MNNKKDTRHLYLSSVDAEFRPGHDLALGPWCFLGMENIDEQWQDQSFLDAFDTQERQTQAPKDCFELSSYLTNRWAEQLNERHGTEYETGFWWPLLARRIYQTTCTVWRRWELINRFIEKYQNETIHIAVAPTSSQASWYFAGNAEFFSLGLKSPEFDLWIYSLCLEKLAPAHWVMSPIENFSIPSFKGKIISGPPVNSNVLKRFGRKVLGRLPFSDIMGVGPVWTLFFSAWVSVIPRRKKAPYFFPETDKLPAIFPSAFIELLDRVLTSTTPECVTTNFNAYNENAGRHRYVLGRLFVSGASHSNDTANFQAAHAIANGEAVVRSQHGSTYGTMAHAHALEVTEYAMSANLTWGWQKHNKHKGRFFPVPAPSLSRIRNGHRPLNKSIILVGMMMSIRSYQVSYYPEPGHMPVYRKEKINFISSLNMLLVKNLYYRPYARVKGELEDGPDVLKHFPAVTIVNGSLEDAMLNCCLLVLDHPGTTMNIAMAANVPTICFWDPKLWPYSEEAAPYFEILRKAGIIFPDGDSAARRINEISDNVQGWWLSDEVQSARQAWANQYARTSGIWWWHWLRTLYKI